MWATFPSEKSVKPVWHEDEPDSSLSLPGNDFPVSQWFTKDGLRVSDGQINSALQAVGVQMNSTGGAIQAAPSSGGSSIDPVQYLLQHGYLQVTSYQPDSRFWTFQWIEFGWLTVLTLLTLGATLWLLRRRSA